MSTTTSACQNCAAPLPSASPGGLCPACLMGEAIGSLDSLPGESPLNPTFRTAPLAPDPLEGTTLGVGGRYKILQRLGEGGFGTVYMAEQHVPVRRRVAVKILKAGMDTRQVVARFEAERQALAMMDHPNIAHVFDGGETEQGRPYFVMELVRGTPITNYCDEEALTTRQRLDLFLKVCRAVQHAHQKGVIHRDLKPANVLVTVEDGAEPVPKIIDFGVAKATEAQLTDKTLFTRFEQMIGTPAYMSPEQAGARAAQDVDTRADIYALGVLLYELLTGTTPFEATTLQRAAFDEVRRILREEEAPRPSARLSSLEAERRTTIARVRGTEAHGLGRQLRGDLDWIVMKAIEKDRRRRYETANALASDLVRFLRGDAIVARPPSTGYKLRKFAGRNKALLITTASIAAILLAASVISSVSAYRAITAGRLASDRLEEVEGERSKTEAAREEAERQRNEALWSQYVARQFPIREAWRNRRFGHLERLLDEQIPRPGQPDFRGWEWSYFRDQCNQAFRTIEGGRSHWHPRRRALFLVAYPTPSESVLELRSPDDGSLLRTVAALPANSADHVRGLRVSTEGTRIAYLTREGGVGVVEVDSGRELFRKDLPEVPPGKNGLRTIDLSHDGKVLATGQWHGLIQLWAVDTGERLRVLHDPQEISNLDSIRFNSTSTHLAAGLRFGQRTTFDLESGEAFDYTRQSVKNSRVAWNRAGTRFVATEEHSFALFELNHADPIMVMPHKSVTAVTWIGDAKIVSCGDDQIVRIWDARSFERLAEYQLHEAAVWNPGVSPDGELLTVQADGAIKVVDLNRPPRPAIALSPETPHRGETHFIAWDQRGERLTSFHQETHGANSFEPRLRIWDVGTEKIAQEANGVGLVKAVGWTADQSAVRAVDLRAEFHQLDLHDGELRTLADYSEYTLNKTASFSSDSRWLALGGDDDVSLICTTRHEIVNRANLPMEATALEWSRNDQLVAIGFWTEIIIWDPFAGRVLARQPVDRRINDLTWHPRDPLLAVAFQDGTIHTVRTDTLKEVVRMQGHRGPVLGVDWGPRGRIASASGDGTVRIWDEATGHELLAFQHPEEGQFFSVRWSPDGRRLAAGDLDGRVFIWESAELQAVPAGVNDQPTRSFEVGD